MAWPDVPHVTVPASGPPDAVAVTLNATGRGDDPADALRACGRTQWDALAALAEAGATDVQSSAITVHDEWDHERNRAGRPQALSTFSATLPDVATAGDPVVRVLQAAPDVRLQALTPQQRDQTELLRRPSRPDEQRHGRGHLGAARSDGLSPVAHRFRNTLSGPPACPSGLYGSLCGATPQARQPAPAPTIFSRRTTRRRVS